MEKERSNLFKAINKILNNDKLNQEEKARMIIHATGVACGIIALQPLPFADIVILTPIQAVMFVGIGKVYGFDIGVDRAKEIVGEVIGVIGMGLIAQHAVIGLYKTILPFAGGLFTVPLVWAFTFGMGRVGIYYFERRSQGKDIDKDEMRRVFKQGQKEGKKEKKTYGSKTVGQDLANGRVSDIFLEITAKLERDQGLVAGINTIYQFNVTGTDGGSWYVDLTSRPTVSQGIKAGAICTITISAQDFVDIMAGKLNGQWAFMTGKLKIEGDMGSAMKLNKILG